MTGVVECLAARILIDGCAALIAAGPRGRIADADELARRIVAALDWEQPGMTEQLLPMAAWLAARESAVRSLLIPSLESSLTLRDAGPHSPALKALARAFLEDTVEAWREALAHAEEGRIPNRYVHVARYRLADSLFTRGDPGDRGAASVHLDQVIAEAPGKGASLIARWARELQADAGLHVPRAAAPRAAASGVSALTRRELQVLALVAEGLTNPQIGQQLFISPKTASVHVSAILAKVGASNRAEAAAMYSSSIPIRQPDGEIGHSPDAVHPS